MAAISLADLLHLSVDERIQLAADLWDSIAAGPDQVPVSDAQRREVLRRSEAHRQNRGEAVGLDEAMERVERSLG